MTGQDEPPPREEAIEWQAMFRSSFAPYARRGCPEQWEAATRIVRQLVPLPWRNWFYTSSAWQEFISHYEATAAAADEVNPGREPIRIHTVRWPRSLHEALTDVARAMGVSLNELTVRTMRATAAVHPHNNSKEAASCRASLTSKT